MSAHVPADIDILVVDCFSLLFRAFHSFPLTLTSPDGQLTNAIFGFTRLLLSTLKHLQPEYIVAAVDMGEPTFRHEQYVDYKANREEAPNELKEQIHFMYEVLAVLNIPTIGHVGYEADDVIGTLAVQLREQHPELDVGILTGDKDSFQLVGENIYVLRPGKKASEGLDLVDTEKVIDVMGVAPEQVIDFKALCGDASDNIPGVKGIGPKTAQQLLHAFGTLQRLYMGVALAAGQQETLVSMGMILPSEEEQGELKQLTAQISPRILLKLAESQDSAWLSQKLARIDTQVPLQFELEQARLSSYDKDQAIEFFNTLGFRSLIRDLPADQFESAIQASLF